MISRSNFDTHGFTVNTGCTVKPPDREEMFVNVPYCCLLPKDLDGILVTGLGVSAHRDAMPVIRMQADIQNQGYAAGVAAAARSRSWDKGWNYTGMGQFGPCMSELDSLMGLTSTHVKASYQCSYISRIRLRDSRSVSMTVEVHIILNISAISGDDITRLTLSPGEFKRRLLIKGWLIPLKPRSSILR